jgi:hypothetical protein
VLMGQLLRWRTAIAERHRRDHPLCLYLAGVTFLQSTRSLPLWKGKSCVPFSFL